MNRKRINGDATIDPMAGTKPQIPKDLRDSLSRAVAALATKHGGEREAARRLGTSQATLNRIKHGAQEPGALMVRRIAAELEWSANRVLGLPDFGSFHVPPSLIEAVTLGRYSGPAIAAATRIDAALDARGWRKVLERLDECVESAIQIARSSHVRNRHD